MCAAASECFKWQLFAGESRATVLCGAVCVVCRVMIVSFLASPWRHVSFRPPSQTSAKFVRNNYRCSKVNSILPASSYIQQASSLPETLEPSLRCVGNVFVIGFRFLKKKNLQVSFELPLITLFKGRASWEADRRCGKRLWQTWRHSFMNLSSNGHTAKRGKNPV